LLLGGEPRIGEIAARFAIDAFGDGGELPLVRSALRLLRRLRSRAHEAL